MLSAVIGFPHENTGGVLEHFAVWWNHLTEHKCGENRNQERFVRLAKCFCRCGPFAIRHLQFNRAYLNNLDEIRFTARGWTNLFRPRPGAFAIA
ncbi:predicted protein [Brucella abortus bv. 4 str. 292]|nr:predicted protein [Brucella abortus bv. 4 str. 292]